MKTAEVELTVTFKVEGDEKRLLSAVREIKSDIRTTLIQDFGREAWGGYDGPTVSRVRVTGGAR